MKPFHGGERRREKGETGSERKWQHFWIPIMQRFFPFFFPFLSRLERRPAAVCPASLRFHSWLHVQYIGDPDTVRLASSSFLVYFFFSLRKGEKEKKKSIVKGGRGRRSFSPTPVYLIFFSCPPLHPPLALSAVPFFSNL